VADLPYVELKDLILKRLSISSTDLEEVKCSFAKLYKDFQTDIIRQVTLEPTSDDRFTWVRSADNNPDKAILFFHGGGYTMGSTEDHLELIAQLVIHSKASVLSVDYHLSPDRLFPAQLDDAVQGYEFLLNNGYNSMNIGFAGISAGALLATQLIFRCQEINLPLPKIALIISGPGNLKFDAPSCKYNLDRDWISTERLRNIQNYYFPDDLDRDLEVLSPMNATYDDYPITLFLAGDYEVLLDDSITFYQNLRSMGHDVFLNVIPKLPHCWQFFAKVYEPGRVANRFAADFLRTYLT
jgi:acetyl esterase/lipase